MKLLTYIKDYFKEHYLAITAALLVGFIYVAPYLFFIVSLGGNYRGIPLMQSANEESYVGRIHEILDGHPLISSFTLFEYKDQLPLSPPIGEFFYALPSLVFGVSLVKTLLVSRFILPAIVFLLIYVLIGRLTAQRPPDFLNKLNAIAGAFWATLGYDLIDFRSLWNFLAGERDLLAGNFLIWTRPVNPILGAIFLFSFLLFLWALWRGTKKSKTCVIFAGLFLALMMASYFFSWGMALSVWGMLVLFAILKKERRTVKSFFLVLFATLLFSSPYWYMSWLASHSPAYAESVLRSGLFYTHYPLINKLMAVVLAVYLVLVVWSSIIKSRPFIFSFDYFKKIIYNLQAWHWFCLSLILGALWAYSQQIVTGVTIWPYHFVQYSIPLAIVVAMTLLFNVIKERSAYLWGAAAGLIIAASLFYGIYAQASVYQRSSPYYADAQSYIEVLNWLNQQPKDCVVLVRQSNNDAISLNKLILAFTHCNNFVSTDSALSLLPDERLLYNYLVLSRINGVKAEEIKSYLAVNSDEARGYLFSNWKGLYGVKEFPDFLDKKLDERLKKLPEDYQQFLKEDFEQELKKYRLDYILSIGPLSAQIKKELPHIGLIKQIEDEYIYQFNSE